MLGVLLLVGAVLALVALLACVIGAAWGPAILALVFAGFGIVMLGSASWGPILGVGLLSAALIEAAAANRFWADRRTSHGPSGAWRTTASLVGLAGSVTVGVLVYALLAFLAWISSF